MNDSSWINRALGVCDSPTGVTPYAMLRYLLLLTSRAKLFPVNSGKGDDTSPPVAVPANTRGG
jgi:hypothetical protein